jgi:hypothetical protein
MALRIFGGPAQGHPEWSAKNILQTKQLN